MGTVGNGSFPWVRSTLPREQMARVAGHDLASYTALCMQGATRRRAAWQVSPEPMCYCVLYTMVGDVHTGHSSSGRTMNATEEVTHTTVQRIAVHQEPPVFTYHSTMYKAVLRPTEINGCRTYPPFPAMFLPIACYVLEKACPARRRSTWLDPNRNEMVLSNLPGQPERRAIFHSRSSSFDNAPSTTDTPPRCYYSF